MILHQSAYLDRNWYRASYPHHDRKVLHRVKLYANTYIRPANSWFGNFELWMCYRLGRVACRAGWCRLCRQLSVSVGWSRTCSFASPVCLPILCGSILARKAARHVVLMKHCQVSLYRSLHLLMPRKLNIPLLLFSDFDVWFLNEIFHFLNGGMRKAFFGNFARIQHQAHVRLFQLYRTSLPCHSSRQVENLQVISCCF